MTNDQQEQNKPKKSQTDSKNVAQQKNVTEEPVKKTKSIKIVHVIAVIALILSIISLWRIHKLATHQTTATDQIGNTAAMLVQHQQTLDNLSTSQDKLTKQVNNLQENFKTVEDMVNSLAQQKLHSEDSLWQLKRAYYLIQLAQFNLRWNHDTNNSKFLLQQADAIIQDLALPDTLGLRQVLANEVSQLAAVAVIDKAGTLAKLSAIAQQIPQLPLLNENYFLPPANNSNANQPASTGGWRNVLHQSLQSLEKILIIRRHDNSVSPLPSAEQRRLLDERIAMLLQQAQWALLQNNSQVYTLSLQQAITVLKQNFTADNPKTMTVLKELNILQQLNIDQTLPDITGSQIKLKQYLKQQAIKNSETNNSEKKKKV